MSKSILLKLFAIVAAFAVVIGGITAAVVVNNKNKDKNIDDVVSQINSNISDENSGADNGEDGLTQIDYSLDEQVLLITTSVLSLSRVVRCIVTDLR